MTDTTPSPASAPTDQAPETADAPAPALDLAAVAEAAAKEAAEYKDKLLLCTLAEMENLRRRAEREVADARLYEELGFFRIIFVVIAFSTIAYRGFLIARFAHDRFGMVTAVGITLWITGQAFINIAVNTGVLPIRGITLAFISYGGSSLVATLMGAGVLLNISKHTPVSSYVSSSNRRRDSGPRYSQSSRD